MLGYIFKSFSKSIFFTLNGEIVLNNQMEPGWYIYNGEFQPIEYSFDKFFEELFSKWQPLYEMPTDLINDIKYVSKIFLKAKFENRFILFRTHNDADGFSAGYSLAKIFPNSTKIIQASPFYTIREAYSDSALMSGKQNKLLILSDLGGNEKSKEGLDWIKSMQIEYIVIDHHPFETDDKNILNSWKYDPSGKYTAGYIASEIARIFNYDVKDIPYLALTGDKSPLYDKQDLIDKALAIDYLTTYSSDLNFIIQIYESDLFSQVIIKAKELYEKIEISKLEKINVKDVTIYFLNAESLDRSEFIGAGKIASYILTKAGENSIVIVYNKGVFTLRISDKVYNRGIDSLKLINYIGNLGQGGGHSKAASFRILPENFNIVKNLLIKKIKESL